mgnify:CR=1 FL=1
MGFTKNQAAGICGNFYNESKFSSDNAQEQKGGKYKNDHDSGYTFSTDDKVGYGIEQWTVPDVKKTLKNTLDISWDASIITYCSANGACTL